jgi:hypothetical protein
LPKSFHCPPLNSRKQFNNDADVILATPKSVQKDMQVWAAIAAAAAEGLPIGQPSLRSAISHSHLTLREDELLVPKMRLLWQP